MNSKQKALGEKAIKVRYNGLINSLHSASTRAEADNPVLPHLHEPRLLRNVPAPSIVTPPNYGDVEEDKKRWDAKTKASATKFKRLYDKLQAAKVELQTCLSEQNEQIKQDNLTRDKIRREASTVRRSVCDQLASERDSLILRVAFEGESAEMMQLLNSLPSPGSIAAMLKSEGITLTKALPETSGIGERLPTALSTTALK